MPIHEWTRVSAGTFRDFHQGWTIELCNTLNRGILPEGYLTAYVDALAVGDPLPDAPLFLAPGWYVNVPLEQTYMAAWDVTPKPIRDLVSPPSAALQ